jgi:hypothetical protein
MDRAEGAMPKDEHVRGVSQQEQRQYERILAEATRTGRYGSRAKEVAARIVLKRHKREVHRRGE